MATWTRIPVTAGIQIYKADFDEVKTNVDTSHSYLCVTHYSGYLSGHKDNNLASHNNGYNATRYGTDNASNYAYCAGHYGYCTGVYAYCSGNYSPYCASNYSYCTSNYASNCAANLYTNRGYCIQCNTHYSTLYNNNDNSMYCSGGGYYSPYYCNTAHCFSVYPACAYSCGTNG